MLVASACRCRLMARLRRVAMTVGPWCVRTWEGSSPKGTSRTQCRRFSMLQWARRASASSAGSAWVVVRSVIA